MEVFSKEMLYVSSGGTPFVQPVLTANGRMGDKAFAVSGTNPSSSSYAVYKAFDNDKTSTWYTPNSGNSCKVIFYNPNPLKVTKLVLVLRDLSPTHGVLEIKAGDRESTGTVITISGYNVEKSGSIETHTITLANTSFYKYYSIIFKTSGTNLCLYDVQITAEEQ